jgi:hypothetical protein
MEKDVTRLRTIGALLLVAVSLTITLGPELVAAQSPTAISVPSPTAEGCNQVPEYLQARQQIFDEMIVGMSSVFPNVATPIMEHGDELFAAMIAMAPEQFEALAKVYDNAAGKIEEIEAPAVAAFYNGLQVQVYRLSADVFQEAAKSGLSNAGTVYQDQLVAIGEAIGTAGEGATSVCPAFADVVELDQTQTAL